MNVLGNSFCLRGAGMKQGWLHRSRFDRGTCSTASGVRRTVRFVVSVTLVKANGRLGIEGCKKTVNIAIRKVKESKRLICINCTGRMEMLCGENTILGLQIRPFLYPSNKRFPHGK
jgi:hypothetical protein